MSLGCSRNLKVLPLKLDEVLPLKTRWRFTPPFLIHFLLKPYSYLWLFLAILISLFLGFNSKIFFKSTPSWLKCSLLLIIKAALLKSNKSPCFDIFILYLSKKEIIWLTIWSNYVTIISQTKRFLYLATYLYSKKYMKLYNKDKSLKSWAIEKRNEVAIPLLVLDF